MFGVEITRREGKVIAPREEIHFRKKFMVEHGFYSSDALQNLKHFTERLALFL